MDAYLRSKKLKVIAGIVTILIVVIFILIFVNNSKNDEDLNNTQSDVVSYPSSYLVSEDTELEPEEVVEDVEPTPAPAPAPLEPKVELKEVSFILKNHPGYRLGDGTTEFKTKVLKDTELIVVDDQHVELRNPKFTLKFTNYETDDETTIEEAGAPIVKIDPQVKVDLETYDQFLNGSIRRSFDQKTDTYYYYSYNMDKVDCEYGDNACIFGIFGTDRIIVGIECKLNGEGTQVELCDNVVEKMTFQAK